MRLALRNRTAAALRIVLVPALVVCAWLAPSASAQSAPDAEAKAAQREAAKGATAAGSRVRGRVVYADSGRPLRRAEVALFDASTGQEAGSAVTDRRGEFVFEGVKAGRYFVTVEAPDVVSAHTLAGRRGSLVAMAALGEIEGGYAEVSVGDKGTAEAEVRARRAGVITGRVTGEDGEPVAGADVKLFRRERGRLLPFEPTWQLLDGDRRALATDSRGVYRIAGLPSGEYVVRVSEGEVGTDRAGEADAAYGDGSLVVAYHPSASNLKDALAVNVTEGSESGGVDVRMPERATYRLGGAVTFGREGVPAAFAEIKVDRKDEGAGLRSSLDVDVRADAEGRWELGGVPDGEYVVTVGNAVRIGPREGGGWVEVAPKHLEARVAGADLLGLNARLSPGARVSGTVTVEGGAKLPSGWQRVDVVSAVGEKARPEGGAGEKAVEFSFVRDDGEFELKGLPAGRYHLRLPMNPSGGLYVKSVTHKGSDLMRSALKVGEGASVEGVRVTLATDLATLSGRAVAAGGTPTPGAALVLIPADAVTRRFVSEPPLTLADRLGRFTLRCAPGDYYVVALSRRPGGAGRPSPLDETFVKRHGAALRRVTLKPGEQLKGVDVTLTKE